MEREDDFLQEWQVQQETNPVSILGSEIHVCLSQSEPGMSPFVKFIITGVTAWLTRDISIPGRLISLGWGEPGPEVG